MALLALAFVLIAAPAAAAEGAPSANDGAIAFVCERKWETDDVSAKVTRYLTGGGRQRDGASSDAWPAALPTIRSASDCQLSMRRQPSASRRLCPLWVESGH